uniref:GS catalytic domain-containing protein n=1 Tax=Panagrolaimus sp. JU765 TaxID=591449 RepID=A0AC34RH74_9BILA
MSQKVEENLHKPEQKKRLTHVWRNSHGRWCSLLKTTNKSVTDSLSTFDVEHSGTIVTLKPVAHYPDPFLGGQNHLVLCETLNHLNEPTKNRAKCKTIMDKIAHQQPWFGIKQEYLLMTKEFRSLDQTKRSESNFCAFDAVGKSFAEKHYEMCQNASLKITNLYAGKTEGSWIFHIGPCEGIAMGDELWIARYLLHRTAEQFGVVVTLDPKPAVTMGDWNVEGCHTKISTAAMRAENGLTVIKSAMTKLAAVDKFTWGVANSAASVRIPRQVAAEKKGYLEDRRPSSNCDPYTVTAAIGEIFLPSEFVDPAATQQSDAIDDDLRDTTPASNDDDL